MSNYGLNPLIAFKKYYESGEQVLTTGGALSLTHNLGVPPLGFEVVLVCKVAQGGYSIGDTVIVAKNNMNGSATRAGSVYVNNGNISNIQYRYPSASPLWQIPNKSTGGFFDLLNTSWKMKIRAWV